MMYQNEWVKTAIRTDDATCVKYSRDQYGYSPILEEQLRVKVADGVVFPESEAELLQVLSYVYNNKLPLTIRGAGTGNYGQAVPIHGGIVMDITALNKILEIGDGFVRAQAGAKMGLLERKVRETGQELRIFPTTFVKSTAAGFVCGGAGGVGSITWGDLWDGDNVKGIVVYTIEEVPRRLEIEGEELHRYVHSYGTTGIVTEVVFPLIPRTEWVQSLVEFDDFEQSMLFSEQLAHDDSIGKRLVCTAEAAIPAYLLGIAKYVSEGSSVVLLETDEQATSAVKALIDKYDGRVTYSIEADQYHKSTSLSDFSFNHTTLWAMKADPSFTYLQAGFSSENWLEQISSVKALYNDDVLLHFEWIRGGGQVVAACLPIVRYRGADHLEKMMKQFEELDIRIYNPHTYVLDDGGRPEFMQGILKAKAQNDPLQLLNPGKLVSI